MRTTKNEIKRRGAATRAWLTINENRRREGLSEISYPAFHRVIGRFRTFLKTKLKEEL